MTDGRGERTSGKIQRLITREEFCDAGACVQGVIAFQEGHFPGRTAVPVDSAEIQDKMYLLVLAYSRRSGHGYGDNPHGKAHGYGCGCLRNDNTCSGYGSGSEYGYSYGYGYGYGYGQTHHLSGSFADFLYLNGYGDGRGDEDHYGWGYGQ